MLGSISRGPNPIVGSSAHIKARPPQLQHLSAAAATHSTWGEGLF